MLNNRVEEALNKQLNAEAFSAYLYMSMAAHFKSLNLTGFATWMEIQAMEEFTHSKKFYEFIDNRGGRVLLTQIDAPATSWDSPLAAFEAALAHEQFVTSRINALMDVALEEKDHATQIFLQWFVTEQVEEESTASAIIAKLKLMADSPGGLFMLDQELGQRPLPVQGTAAAGA